jgi:hypothetical protein
MNTYGEKQNFIISKIMNCKKLLNEKYNNYLQFVINQLSEMYPIVNKNREYITKYISIIDNYNIHPSIYSTIFVNCINNLYIQYQIKDLESIVNLPHNVNIIFSQFDDIFNHIDVLFPEPELSKEIKIIINYIDQELHYRYEYIINNIKEESNIDNKLEYDSKIFNQLIELFPSIINKNMLIIEKDMNLLEDNYKVIYFWINYIAILNKKLLEKIL